MAGRQRAAKLWGTHPSLTMERTREEPTPSRLGEWVSIFTSNLRVAQINQGEKKRGEMWS